MPSSSSVEAEVEFEFKFEDGAEFEDFSCCLYFHGWVGGWSGKWSEDWRIMLNSTQDQIKLKLKFEMSLAIRKHRSVTMSPFF